MVWHVVYNGSVDLSWLNVHTGGIFSLLMAAGPVAKAVVLILFLFSIVSWTIMFYKWREFGLAEKEAHSFLRAVKEVGSFKKLASTYRENKSGAFYRLILAAYREITTRQRENPRVEAETVPLIENALRITISEETTRLERRLSFLATTANAAPFIGLFGTVWGIMDSFREIGVRGSTSLAVVAPGISEALIATAIGLATAIPAVLGYNYFLGRLKRLTSMMENASMHIINALER
jgi:biopolymer transport protein TolQ